MLLNLGLLFILVIFIGYFAAISKDRRFDLSKAFAFVACETVIGIILFATFSFLVYKIGFSSAFSDFLGNLFMVILNIAIINGIILYRIIRLAYRN